MHNDNQHNDDQHKIIYKNIFNFNFVTKNQNNISLQMRESSFQENSLFKVIVCCFSNYAMKTLPSDAESHKKQDET